MAEMLATFRLVGVTPLIQHNPASMGRKKNPDAGATRKGKDIPSPEQEAEAGLYLDGDGGCLMGSIGFRNGTIKCGAYYAPKAMGLAGKMNVKSRVSHIRFALEFVPLLKPDGSQYRKGEHEIDTRRAVVQRQGILRSRPKFTEWMAVVGIIFDPELTSENVLLTLAKDAGQTKGMGDYRPECGGWFGRYLVELLSVEQI